MTDGAKVTVIASLALMWGASCGTHSAIGSLQDGGVGGALAGGIGGGSGGTGAGTGGGTGGIFVPPCPGAGGGPAMRPPKSLAFNPPVDYPTGSGATAVATGDVNGDGKPDLVLLDVTAGIRVMLNKGDGTFGGPVNHSLGSLAPGALAVGDLDGDGQADIATLTQLGVVVLINQGNADFAPPVNYVVGNNSAALALGDLNGDGKLDIAVADLPITVEATGDVGILLNTGSGTFVAANYPAGRLSAAIAIRDVNGDCRPDLVVVGMDGVTVLANDSGGFLTPRSFATGTSGVSVAIADINGDGKPDVVEGTGAVNDGRTYVLLNHGNGNTSFNAPVAYGLIGPGTSYGYVPGAQSVALADMNDDGRPDLLALGDCCGLGVFLNHGDGTFAPAINFPTQPSPLWIAVDDLNGDGLPDVAVVSGDGGNVSALRVLINSSH